MSENKIVPLGGKHRSAKSMLAEIMNDPDMASCVVFTFDGKGNMGFGQFGVSSQEMAFASSGSKRERVALLAPVRVPART